MLSIDNQVLQDQAGEVREKRLTEDPSTANSPYSQLIYSSSSFLLGSQKATPSLSRLHPAAVRTKCQTTRLTY